MQYTKRVVLCAVSVSKAMRQVFVFSEQTPLGRDVAGLLQPETELDTLGWETDLDRAIRRIHENHPPAVIVVGQDVATDCGPSVARIQHECPGLQIAEVNLESRVVRLHIGDDCIVEELRELLKAVDLRGTPTRDRSPAHGSCARQKGSEGRDNSA
jgi:hypothetical protein